MSLFPSLISRLKVLLITRMPFYAVRKGRKPGVYNTWAECQKQVDSFQYAKYRKFSTEQEALQFVNGFDNPGGLSTTPVKAAVFPSIRAQTVPSTQNGLSHFSQTEGPLSVDGDDSANSPVKSIDYQLRITDEEINLLKEKLSHLENKKALLVKEKVLEQKKIGLSPEKQVKSETKVKSSMKTQQRKSPYKDVTSGSWSQNRTTKLIDIQGTRKSSTVTDGGSGLAVVYTDGACSCNGKQGARAGIGVYWGEDHPLNVSERLPGRQTNNRAEIFAAVKAVQQAKTMGLSQIVIKTDSNFLIQSITEWVPSWIRKGWKTATGKPVINKDDFQTLLKEMEGITVFWEHVAGHQGVVGNERADRLAVAGANKS